MQNELHIIVPVQQIERKNAMSVLLAVSLLAIFVIPLAWESGEAATVGGIITFFICATAWAILQLTRRDHVSIVLADGVLSVSVPVDGPCRSFSVEAGDVEGIQSIEASIEDGQTQLQLQLMMKDGSSHALWPCTEIPYEEVLVAIRNHAPRLALIRTLDGTAIQLNSSAGSKVSRDIFERMKRSGASTESVVVEEA